jgi:hypothetical protein
VSLRGTKLLSAGDQPVMKGQPSSFPFTIHCLDRQLFLCYTSSSTPLMWPLWTSPSPARSQDHRTTAPEHHSTIAPQYHSTTEPLYHTTTVLHQKTGSPVNLTSKTEVVKPLANRLDSTRTKCHQSIGAEFSLEFC